MVELSLQAPVSNVSRYAAGGRNQSSMEWADAATSGRQPLPLLRRRKKLLCAKTNRPITFPLCTIYCGGTMPVPCDGEQSRRINQFYLQRPITGASAPRRQVGGGREIRRDAWGITERKEDRIQREKISKVCSACHRWP